jgi:hypothetical protein
VVGLRVAMLSVDGSAMRQVLGEKKPPVPNYSKLTKAEKHIQQK